MVAHIVMLSKFVHRTHNNGRYSRNRVSWGVLGLLLALGIGYTWATWSFFTRQVPGGNDFLANCAVWEPFLREGISPYSEQAALHTQSAIYGRAALPGEDENRLVYPFYSLVLHGPFVYLDYAVARAIYMTLLQAALFAGIAVTLDLFHWRPPNWLLAATLGWSLLFYPVARGIILGQFAIFGFFSLAGTLFCLKRRRDAAAGALLVLSTFKPTLVFLVVPFLLIWGVAHRRWRFIIGFLATLTVLVVGSLAALPTWIGEWFYRVTMYSDYTAGQSPVWLLTNVAFPGLGQIGEIVIAAGLLLGMFLSWRLTIRPEGDKEFYWAFGATLVVSNLIVPRSATTNYVLMLIPILWVFAALDRRGRWGRLGLLAIMLVSLVGLWWLHLTTVVGNQEQAIMFLPPPLVLGAVLLFGRRWLVQDTELAMVHP